MNGLRDYHRKAQARAKKAYRNRGSVIWVSCQVVEMPKLDAEGKPVLDVKGDPVLIPFKRRVNGTRQVRGARLRGKAAIKAAKRLTHTKGHYASQRSSVL